MTQVIEVGVPVDSVSFCRAIPADAAVTLEVESMVPLGDPVAHLWVRGPDCDTAVSALKASSESTVSVLDRRAGSVLLRTIWEDSEWPLFDRLEASDGVLLSAQCDGEQWLLRLRFPDTAAVSTFYESCDANGIEVAIREIGGGADWEDSPTERLSARQEETLRVAFEEGYFEVPRQTSIRELAAKLGVSEQSVSERLRRGLTTLVDATVLPDTREADDAER